MDKVKIQEIAAEAGMSNNEVLAKAKELGYNVKVAGSSVTLDQAAMLMDYVMTGRWPADLPKPGAEKPRRIKVVKKKSTETVESTTGNETAPAAEAPVETESPAEAVAAETPAPASEAPAPEKTPEEAPVETEETAEAEAASGAEAVNEVEKSVESPAATEEEAGSEAEAASESETAKAEPEAEPEAKAEPKKAPRKRAGITATAKKSPEEAEELPKPRAPRMRKGITIVKKARPSVPSRQKKISLSGMAPAPSRKKKKKGPAEAKSAGERLEILGERNLGGTVELFEEQEVVLLDFSDKTIFEEQQRQEERRRAEAKRRAAQGIGGQQRNFPNRAGGRNIRRRGKRRKYTKQENTEKVSVVRIPEDVRVYEFAEKVGKSVGEVVKVLFALGTMVTKNDFLDKDSIEILAEEFDVQVETINPLDALDYVAAYDAEPDTVEEPRPPVITIMGHVDHGKTSLLDYIRSTKVAEKEAGGITQHVGAYQIEKDGKKITFIDTPGHSAFTEMRARGAQATDIAIIVVAADDGVMPQTKESISHAQAAGVPIVIAITKIDKPTANPDNVKSQLAEIGILPIDWGGEYEVVEVSSHTGEGIDDLLETILLQAEVMELVADPTRRAKAIVIESSVEKGFGPVANVIIKNGTLHVGDNVIVGTTFGRVRTLILDDGSRAKEIGPSTPAAVVGLHDVPQAGEVLVAMESEKEARELAEKRKEYARAKELSKSTKVSLDELGSLIAEGKIKKLPLIVKADVQGSLEAIKSALEELHNEEVKVEVIHGGVGGITESDVLLADADENAIIMGFNVRPTGAVKKKAQDLGVEIKTYSIIYDMIDEVKALLGGMMSPVVSEEVTGQAEVRETFSVAKVGTIAGCMVTEGVIERNAGARLIRNGVVVYTSKISSLKRFSEDAKEVRAGYECGIMLENFNDIKVGDVIETFKEVEEQATL
ncbi:translation initiation factor IF-2 [Nitratifractor sp.]|uniref:translation initiation factor IF-2 n=1 Tax=Nitratifractor sp. TaxID=2268144 RepID=UPI0025FBD465|nr:translation initiation factor IF-2 [Nitratifractor sp.]